MWDQFDKQNLVYRFMGPLMTACNKKKQQKKPHTFGKWIPCFSLTVTTLALSIWIHKSTRYYRKQNFWPLGSTHALRHFKQAQDKWRSSPPPPPVSLTWGWGFAVWTVSCLNSREVCLLHMSKWAELSDSWRVSLVTQFTPSDSVCFVVVVVVCLFVLIFLWPSLKASIEYRTQLCYPISCYGKPVDQTNEIAR